MTPGLGGVLKSLRAEFTRRPLARAILALDTVQGPVTAQAPYAAWQVWFAQLDLYGPAYRKGMTRADAIPNVKAAYAYITGDARVGPQPSPPPAGANGCTPDGYYANRYGPSGWAWLLFDAGGFQCFQGDPRYLGADVPYTGGSCNETLPSGYAQPLPCGAAAPPPAPPPPPPTPPPTPPAAPPPAPPPPPQPVEAPRGPLGFRLGPVRAWLYPKLGVKSAHPARPAPSRARRARPQPHHKRF